MKKINFRDRKILTLGLCLVFIFLFTLTIAYSALSTVLTIQGNAKVVASNWDIYLDNPRVTNGSVTTNLPLIKTSNTLEFSTTLNMPGDFYEFVVDVVNAGDIDAMIENVIKNPELTVEQAKFLKYEVSYQNGESISTKQTLFKDTIMPIKVRIEYRSDLNASDLPTGQVVLDLSLTLEYIQSDGSGSSVPNNGLQVVFADGNVFIPGTIVTIGTEKFYTIGTEGDNVKLLAMYNLYVGGTYESGWSAYGDEATGIQDSTMLGCIDGQVACKGTTVFSSEKYWNAAADTYVYNSNSTIYPYVENYKTYLENQGLIITEARLIKVEELVNLGCDKSSETCYGAPLWVYSTSYWSGSLYDTYSSLWRVRSNNSFRDFRYYRDERYGVRPVIVISKDYFS